MAKARDDKLLVEEARRTAQHREVKSTIQEEVNAAIEAKSRPSAAEAEVTNVAAELREKALRGVETQEREVTRSRALARVSQVIDYSFTLVYAALGIRLLLALVAARPGSGFVQFIESITDPLYAPFRGILPNLTAEDGYTLVLPVLFAIAMYAVLHLLIKGFLRLVGYRRTSF
ncbi:MAG: YggT family protein [Gemmatimonadales bacterium]